MKTKSTLRITQLITTLAIVFQFAAVGTTYATPPACFEVNEGVSVKDGYCLGFKAPQGTSFQDNKCYKYPPGAPLGAYLTEVDCAGIRSLVVTPPATPTPPTSPTPPSGTPPPPGAYGNLESSNAVQDVAASKLFTDYLIPLINILSAGVLALAAVFMVVAGIQYSSGRDNPQAVSAAKARILNVIIGLLAYMFIYGFLQFIIPGGYL
jgi:hypothetical protein